MGKMLYCSACSLFLNINFRTVVECVRETASCCAATIALQLTPGLRLVLDRHPPATIDFMADLVTKWLDDAIIAQPVDGMQICFYLQHSSVLYRAELFHLECIVLSASLGYDRLAF